MCAQIDVRNSTAGKAPEFFLCRTRKIHHTEASETIMQNG